MSLILFSIVIPTYNRPGRLAAFLESVTRLDYPRAAFEVVVVDDGSDVDLEPVAAGFRDRLNVAFLRQDHGGVARGRHAGACAARGMYLAFTDDDCRLAPDWLTKLEQALEATPQSAAGGYTINALPGNPYSTASQALISYLYEKLNADPANPAFFTGNNAAFPRDLYHRIGGLDVTWPMCGEDRDVCARWRSHGFAMTYVPDAVVHHAHDLDLRRFWRQHFNYGRGARRFRRTCAERGDTLSTRFERLSFYVGLPLAALRHAAGSRPLLVASLLVLSQISNVAGYVREWMRPSDMAPTWQVETSR